MSTTFDSVYPDFLKTGLGKLHTLGVQRELHALFAALENFRRDLHAQESVPGILNVTHRYIAGLDLFRTTGFYLINPGDFGFELTLCVPQEDGAALERLVAKQIQAGHFAAALRQSSPVPFQSAAADAPERGLFHSLALANQALGMFCGLLHREPAPAQDIAFSLLSLLLGASADALATARKTAQLTSQITTLSGLLPICSWCKRVRDDQGYWEQIELYISDHSDAAFTHGICPQCKEKFLASSGRK